VRRLAAALLLALAPVACTGGSGGGDDGGGQQPPPNPGPTPTVTESPVVPPTGNPPVGVTWNVGFADNVSIARMQGFFAALVATNNAVWNLSEGQVRIDRIRFSDAVSPGLTVSQYLSGAVKPDTSGIDVLVFAPAAWDVPGLTGAVGEFPGQGRTGRVMIVPEGVSNFILMHEASHLLFLLTWSVADLLVDEYNDGIQDVACVMESENLPHRWCSDANHTSQISQPHSCWRQLLQDYVSFKHTGADSAPGFPATPKVEYNDTP